MIRRTGDILLVIFGSMLMGIGIDFTVKSGFGLDSLSLLNAGIGKQLDISLGRSSQLLMITILVALFFVDRKRVGLGSIINGILVGTFANMFMPLIDQLNGNTFLKLMMLFLGLTFMSIGIGTYVSGNLGEAGIDALMIFISEKLRKDVNITRIIIDILLAGIGFLLGGLFGIGTLIAMFMNGPIIQITINSIDKIRENRLIQTPK